MLNHLFSHQLIFDGFETEFEKWLEGGYRWVLLSRIIPWEALSEGYEMSLSAYTGRPATDVIDVLTDLLILRGLLCSSGQSKVPGLLRRPLETGLRLLEQRRRTSWGNTVGERLL